MDHEARHLIAFELRPRRLVEWNRNLKVEVIQKRQEIWGLPSC
jgi:hypothetical protein